MIDFISVRLLANCDDTSLPDLLERARTPAPSRYARMSCRISLAVE